MHNFFSKRGAIFFLFSSIAFLITVIFLIQNTNTLRQEPVGEEAFTILRDVQAARSIDFYVRQSLRNSAYAALADLQRKGFFAPELDGTPCPFVKGKALLFADTSCSYTSSSLEQHYLRLVKEHFASSFSQSLYGMNISAADLPFTMTSSSGSLVFSGASSRPFFVTGDATTYTFSLQYTERISYDLHHFSDVLDSLRKNLSCIKSFAAQPEGPTDTTFGLELLKRCSFSPAFTWVVEKQGDLIFFTTTTKEPVLFLDNLSFAFAISLNNLQVAQPDTSLF